MPCTAATTDLHYTKHKSYWPVGGPSEISINMVPVIGRSGGKAFVGASGTHFNRNNFDLSFGLKNNLSFGLRFPYTKKMSKNG